jgi:hypothetical protein
MVQSTLWITVASLLAVFNITKAIGKDGKILEPSYEYHSAIVSYVFKLSGFQINSKDLQNALPIQMLNQTTVQGGS